MPVVAAKAIVDDHQSRLKHLLSSLYTETRHVVLVAMAVGIYLFANRYIVVVAYQATVHPKHNMSALYPARDDARL